MKRAFLFASLCAAVTASTAQGTKLIPVTLALLWYPQPEDGQFFAAKAEGIYEKHGLDVTIRPGGPQVNVQQLMAAGQSDFAQSSSMRTLNARNQGVPIVTVAAIFQKEAVTLLVHESSTARNLTELKGKKIHLPGTARINYWSWLKARYGFTDDQIRPYDPSYRAFALDRDSASQGFITNDGLNCAAIQVSCRSLLLADFGWGAYGNTLDTTDKVIAERPEVVRAMVRASSEGWKRYMENPAKAHALIRQMNPQQEMARMEAIHKVLRERGLAESPDTRGGRYGAMSDARWETFFKEMAASGALPETFDYRKAYTLQFVKDL
jgi:NitT/TauT family transport system substrate-binding protein